MYFIIKENVMAKQLSSTAFFLAAVSLSAVGTASADYNVPIYMAADNALENTQRNARDENGTTLTPEDQNETEGDINITADIRKSVVNDSNLSVNAQNIKIITRNGKVTLRGTVESTTESTKLQQIATQTPGVLGVDNQIESKTP
jgi:hyperosmotically inducible periplasmic protein